MTRTEIMKKKKESNIETIKLYNKYGAQIKVCNSPKSTKEDYNVLNKIKEKWHEASLEATKYETLYTSFYSNKNGKNNTQEKESIAL